MSSTRYVGRFSANCDVRRKERGTSIVETAIVLPFLLMVFMAVVDLGVAINKYLSVTRATYEGIRHGIGLYGNSPGCRGPECSPDSMSTANLNAMDGRVKQILRLRGFPSANVTLESRKTVDQQTQKSYNLISITVQATHNPLLPFFRLIPIRTHISHADLYKDEDAP